MVFPLRLQPQPSRTLRVIAPVLHLLALAALWYAALSPLWQGAGTSLLAVSLWFSLRPTPQPMLRAHADGRLEILRDESWQPLQLSASSTALPWLIVLRWREGWRRRTLTLPADALEPDTHRRLRVWLRWKAAVA